jgi:hypothetical protein
VEGRPRALISSLSSFAGAGQLNSFSNAGQTECRSFPRPSTAKQNLTTYGYHRMAPRTTTSFNNVVDTQGGLIAIPVQLATSREVASTPEGAVPADRNSGSNALLHKFHESTCFNVPNCCILKDQACWKLLRGLDASLFEALDAFAVSFDRQLKCDHELQTIRSKEVTFRHTWQHPANTTAKLVRRLDREPLELLGYQSSSMLMSNGSGVIESGLCH